MEPTVVARRKRGAAAFLDDPFAPAKRGRCSLAAAADLGIAFPLEVDSLEALRLIFPDENQQVLQDHLQASGDVLEAAIRAYKDYLADRSTGSASPITYVTSDNEASHCTPSKGVAIPTNGPEWAELLVREMSSASDLVDAKNRAFKILNLFERSTAQSSPDEKSKVHDKEHEIVKQMLGAMIHQNGILKRAFLIQHNRLKEYHKMVQERSQLNQTVEKYENQIKALEDKNYALSLHLQNVYQCGNTYWHRNPDVF